MPDAKLPSRSFAVALDVIERGATIRYAGQFDTAGELAHVLRGMADAIEATPAEGQSLPHAMIQKTLAAKFRKKS